MGPELFDEAEFERLDVARWRALAEKALKGADFEETLVSRTLDGIRYGPIAERRGDALPILRADPASPWGIVQRVDDPDFDRAATQVRADLDGGATGLAFALEGAAAAYGFGIAAADLARHMASLEGALSLSFETGAGEGAIVLDALEARDEGLFRHADLGLSPLDAATGPLLQRAFELDISCTVFRADGRLAHNSGASEAQELAFALAAAAAALRLAEEADVPPEDALAATEFSLAADASQFLTIAKFRAMRRLHARMQSVLGVAETFPARISAQTSFRMLSHRDAESNILRNTIAAFSAGIGGADAITVLPHSFAHGLPERFARRIARNTQTVLIDESHLAHVADPAAGAGAVEDLTDALAERAWGEFQAIEREGGLGASLASGALIDRVAVMRRERAARLASGEEAIVGTTIYPAAQERAVDVLLPASPPGDGPLEARPLYADFSTGESA